MRFHQLASKNVSNNWQRYLAYFLSCVFSVMVFYVFMSFVLHPGLEEAFNPVNGSREAQAIFNNKDSIMRGLFLCNAIIVVFSSLFILYSNAAFLRSRKQEFGLLTLMGMTRKQMRRMVFRENMTIATLALGVGLLAGILLSKLFYMAMGVIMGLDVPLGFAIPPLALGLTAGVFMLLFLVLTSMTLFTVGRSRIIALLRARRQPRPSPVLRPWLLPLAVALIGYGYYMALGTTLETMLIRMGPILALVIFGTYLLFRQGAAGVCRVLQSTPTFNWRGTNLLSVNRLMFRLKDTANILFVSSILIAVVITGLGVSNTVVQNARQTALNEILYALSIDFAHHSDREGLVESVTAILEEHGHNVSSQLVLTGKTNILTQKSPITPESGRQLTRYGLVISNSVYNELAAGYETLRPIHLDRGEVALVFHYQGHENSGYDVSLPVQLSGLEDPLSISEIFVQVVAPSYNLFVVADEQYARLPAKNEMTSASFEFAGWENSGTAIQALTDYLASEHDYYRGLRSRHTAYTAMRRGGTLIMFMGVFVSMLFFVACGSFIYFKLYTELEEDRRQFRTLRDMGITGREVKRVLTQEIGLLFVLPWLIGCLHAAFALLGMQEMLTLVEVELSVTAAGLMIMLGYGVFQYLYFTLTRASFQRQLA